MRDGKYPLIDITPSLTLTGVIAPVRVLFMGQIEQIYHSTVCRQMIDIKLNC